MTEREKRTHHPVRAPFVIDEAAGPELGKCQEPRGLKVRLTPATVAARRDIREEWQPREVVPGQEALRGQVAVCVEVAREGTRAALEQVELVDRLRVAGLRRALFLVRRGVVVHRPARGIPLLLGGREEISPPVEGLVEALR